MRWKAALLWVVFAAGALPAAERPQILWQRDYEVAVADAQLLDRPLFIYITSKWCPHCLRLERTTFRDREVIDFFTRSLVAVRIDADASPELARQFQAQKYPLGLICDSSGTVHGRMEGSQPTAKYLAELRRHCADLASTLATRRAAPRVVISGIAPTAKEEQAVAEETASEKAVAAVAAVPPVPQIGRAEPVLQNRQAVSAANTPPDGPAPESPAATKNLRLAVHNAIGASDSEIAQTGASPDRQTSVAIPVATPATEELHASDSMSPPERRNEVTMLAHNKITPIHDNGDSAAPPAVHVEMTDATAGSMQPADAGEPQVNSEAGFELMIDGFCPVTLRETRGLVTGQQEVAAAYDNRIYWFAGAAQRERFMANPLAYVPALHGNCPVSYADGRTVKGSGRFGAVYRGRLYLFAGREERRRFQATPSRYAHRDIVLGGYCPICFVTYGRLTEGGPNLQHIYGGRLYRFDTPEHWNSFLANPAAYRDATTLPHPPGEVDAAH